MAILPTNRVITATSSWEKDQSQTIIICKKKKTIRISPSSISTRVTTAKRKCTKFPPWMENRAILHLSPSPPISSLLIYVLSPFSSNVKFGLLSPFEMMKLSHIQVSHREMYTSHSRKQVPHGVLDLRLVRFLLTFLKKEGGGETKIKIPKQTGSLR